MTPEIELSGDLYILMGDFYSVMVKLKFLDYSHTSIKLYRCLLVHEVKWANEIHIFTSQ